MTIVPYTYPSSYHFFMVAQTSEELDYYNAETAEDLEISPEELVRQAEGSYCRVKLGGSHE